MQNVVFNSIQTFSQKFGCIIKISYQQATNQLIIVNDQFKLLIIQFNPKDNSFKIQNKTQRIQQLSNSKIILLQFIIDLQKIVCITQNGLIFTIDQKGQIDIKAENQDGIVAASISPTQQYLYLITKNSTIVQLDIQFDLVNQVPLDDAQQTLPNDPKFTWRPDGNYFALNFQTKDGRKCVTREKMMNIFISPAKSDPNPKDPVQSVAQKGRQNMGISIAWQPSGGIIAGTDFTQNKHRIIFWQKNGLRHLQFQLLNSITKINDLFWSTDSSILYVDVQINQKRSLLLYYRSNYKWHLKNQINLSQNMKVLSFKTKNNKILIANQNQLKLIDFTLEISRNQWHTKQQEKINSYSLVYCIDSSQIKINDYSKALIPPPFALHNINLQSTIIGHSIKQNLILLITHEKIYLYRYQDNKIIKQFVNPGKQIYSGILILNNENQSLKFIANNHFYEEYEGKILKKDKCSNQDLNQRAYKLKIKNSDNQQEIIIKSQKKGTTLIVNNNVLTQDCLSYIFYHEFLLYTVSTNEMYDRMIIFNLKLDKWIWDDSNFNITQKIQELEQTQKLNLRNVQRGSKIITCTQGRVVFQLPRGNLEGIYPKIIMINQVKNKMQDKQYGKAFEYVRTHRLDINLLVDLNPIEFSSNASEILASINRVDYLNLLISQISQKISTQIYYALTQDQIQQVNQYFDTHLRGKKVKKICQIITKSLRALNQQKYILSIFTSQIKRGLLNQVLFEIKDLKKNDVQTIIAPHIKKNKNPQQKTKKLNSQQILQYVCWLVDANYIYEAALLTYDLQLAAMTARCTQKDPKQYLPYIQSLKKIQNAVQFKKKICLDLKKYEIAIRQLSRGSEQHKKEAIQLIKTHKLYKCGLQTFSQQASNLKQVKLILIDQLLSNGQTNQAYQMSKSINDYQKCLQIATKNMQTKKIKECLQSMINISKQDKIKKAKQIIQAIKQQIRNKSDLARLYIYVNQYEQAIINYIKAGDYKKFYQYINKVSQQFIEKQVISGLKLQCSLKKNALLKDKQLLLKVQKQKKNQGGEVHTFRNKQNQDMYSQVSVASKTSSYTMSTTTGMRKKKDKKRHILTRNVKQGSILQEQYLLAYLDDLRSKVDQHIRDAKLLVQHLIYMNMIEEVEQIKNIINEYIEVMNEPKAKSFAKIKFQQIHPQAVQLYYEEKNNHYTFDSFNYLLEPNKK